MTVARHPAPDRRHDPAAQTRRPAIQLDTTLRARMRTLLRRSHDDSGITTFFVMHTQSEAVEVEVEVEVAETIALMLGTPAGHGTPESFHTRQLDATPHGRGERRIGRVVAARSAGTHLAIDIELGNQRLRVHHPAGRPITIGESNGVGLPPEACTVLSVVGP